MIHPVVVRQGRSDGGAVVTVDLVVRVDPEVHVTIAERAVGDARRARPEDIVRVHQSSPRSPRSVVGGRLLPSPRSVAAACSGLWFEPDPIGDLHPMVDADIAKRPVVESGKGFCGAAGPEPPLPALQQVEKPMRNRRKPAPRR